MQYISFVLAAMGADYYPRLTALINDHEAATRLVNEQTEIALLLSAPVFIAMIGLAPWIIQLLYSSAFLPSVVVLRWQILGDVLKVASWPLGFVLLATGAGKTFLWTETLVLVLMGSLVAGLSSLVGLQITGIAFLACYAVYLPLVYLLAWKHLAFKWTDDIAKLVLIIFLMCMMTAGISINFRWGVLIAGLLSISFAIYSIGKLTKMINAGGVLGRTGRVARCITGSVGLNVK